MLNKANLCNDGVMIFANFGQELSARLEIVFKKVNLSKDGEMMFTEFQRAIVDTDVSVQVCGFAATRCNTLHHAATHCNTLQHTALQHTTLHCDTLQHDATHCNATQHKH